MSTLFNIGNKIIGDGLSYIFNKITPTAGYSLRYLSTNYFGQPVVRVRKDVVGSPEQDFTPNQLTDGTLATFADGNDCFVSKWYDQFGSYDARQTTADHQPKIWDASTGLVTDNGKPAILPDGVDDHFDTSNQTLKSIFIVAEPETVSKGVVGGYIATLDDEFAYRSDDYNAHDFPSKTTQSLWSAFAIGSANPRDIYAYRDGVASVDNPISLDLITDCDTLLNRFGASSGPYSKRVQEIIIYNSDQSANRTKIENNINNYYNIYS